ncbi:MAG: 2-succinyl-5-enolpyruvyl-6-hydroxy-3-cyclohexene-1-carboxylic-acid synthase [Ktedonobacterales bacterium]
MSSSMPPQVGEPANELYAYIGAFVDELCRAGVRHAVVCPGSRSTPLALSLAQQSGIRLWMQVDERSAGFFALGMARRLRQPVALLCTSGTAAANFYPAVIEAGLSHLPLLVLTADRPHELRDCGAPQAIDQNQLYGQQVKWYMEIAPASATNESLRYIRTMADRAAAAALAIPAGVVHLNFPISDPLTPVHRALIPAETRDAAAWSGRPNGAAYTVVSDAPLATPPAPKLAELFEMLSAIPRGLIIAGPQADPGLAEPLLALARTLGYPVLADPLSQLRMPDAYIRQTTLVTTYDAFLPSESERSEEKHTGDDEQDAYAPAAILRFGAMPTSKSLLLYIQRHAVHCPLIVVSGDCGWNESTQLASEMIHCDPAAFCISLRLASTFNNRNDRREKSAGGDSSMQSLSQWESLWRRTENLARRTLGEAILTLPEFFEGRVFTELARLLPPESALFAGNSMPVRDLDTFFWGGKTGRTRIFGNRGANGIDGVVSSALGMSAASHTGERTVLVIGDLSFYHDSNGLLAALLHHLDITIILVNNDGGGIFSFLPQSAYPEHFEELFGTPTGLDFEPLVRMYGGHFERVRSWDDFEMALQSSWQSGGLWVIEVPTNRSTNVLMHRHLRQHVRQALQVSGAIRTASLDAEGSEKTVKS